MIILMKRLNEFLIKVKNHIKNHPNRIVLMVYFLLVLPFINELIFKYGEGTFYLYYILINELIFKYGEGTFYLYYILGGVLVSFTRRMLEIIWIKTNTEK